MVTKVFTSVWNCFGSYQTVILLYVFNCVMSPLMILFKTNVK